MKATLVPLIPGFSASVVGNEPECRQLGAESPEHDRPGQRPGYLHRHYGQALKGFSRS